MPPAASRVQGPCYRQVSVNWVCACALILLSPVCHSYPTVSAAGVVRGEENDVFLFPGKLLGWNMLGHACASPNCVTCDSAVLSSRAQTPRKIGQLPLISTPAGRKAGENLSNDPGLPHLQHSCKVLFPLLMPFVSASVLFFFSMREVGVVSPRPQSGKFQVKEFRLVSG